MNNQKSNTMLDEFGNWTTVVESTFEHGGVRYTRVYPKPVPWEICQCGYLPREDRDYCTKHGANAEPQPQSDPEPQPRRVVSVGRTRPLHDDSSGDAALDKIEGIMWQATVEGELTSRQLGALRWALRKCRSIMTELREDFESL